MKLTLEDLNHRQLAPKINADLIAVEHNLDILYISGKENTILYTETLTVIAQFLERLTNETYEEASDILLKDYDKVLEGIAHLKAARPTKEKTISKQTNFLMQ